MQATYHRMYSPSLMRDMEVNVYGTQGKPCVVFPSQNGRYFDFESFDMIEPCRPWLEAGKLRLFCVDSIDRETWSNREISPRKRIERHELWFRYLTEEFYPWMIRISGEEEMPFTIGCSMGATHAANLFFRRPDLFDGLISLSGTYDARLFFGDYMDELVYYNSPYQCLKNMRADHPYIKLFERAHIVLCVGQGAWEKDMLESTRAMQKVFEEKGIRAWVDIWGSDVAHDWIWWRKQLHYFLEKILGEA